MALATASATMESSSSLIQSESRVQRSYQEVQVSEQRTVKKKTKSRRHKDEGTISVVSSTDITILRNQIKLSPYLKYTSDPSRLRMGGYLFFNSGKFGRDPSSLKRLS